MNCHLHKTEGWDNYFAQNLLEMLVAARLLNILETEAEDEQLTDLPAHISMGKDEILCFPPLSKIQHSVRKL